MAAVVIVSLHKDRNDAVELRRKGSKWSVLWWEHRDYVLKGPQTRKFYTNKDAARAFYQEKVRDIAVRRAVKALGLASS